jgi:hypothetical protein
VPGLRAQQTLLFEDKTGSNKETANYGEDDANDLWCDKVNGERWADNERWVETLRLPETCKDDLAEEEAEGVADDDEGMMVKNQACGLIIIQLRALAQERINRRHNSGHHIWVVQPAP